MTVEKKVVELSSHSRRQGANSGLPQPLMKLKKAFSRRVVELLAQTYQGADDLLFARADKAESGIEQTAYFDAARSLRLGRQSMDIAFGKLVDRGFDALVSGQAPAKTASFDTSELSLLDKDEVELTVAIDSMVNRALDQNSSSLGHLLMRFQCLVPDNEFFMSELPIGPRHLVSSFSEVLSDINIDIRPKLVILKIFEKLVVGQLGAFYTTANDYLIKQGVMPGVTHVPQAQQRQHPEKAEEVLPTLGQEDATEHGNFPEQNDSTQVPMGRASAAGTAIENERLAQLLRRAAGADVAKRGLNISEGFLSDVAPMVGTDEIVDALSRVQTQQVHVPGVLDDYHCDGDGERSGLVDFNKLLKQFSPQEGPISFDKSNAEAISLVSMLFEFVLEDPSIPEKMRGLISQLQVPLLKTALIDNGFFSVSGHPARKLLNEISRSTIGWEDKQIRGRDHLFEKIEETIIRVLSDFDTNVDVYHDLLQDFQKFVDVDRRRGELIARRVQDAEEGKAQSELAVAAVETKIEQEVEGKNIPVSLVPLITEGWQRLMQVTYLKGGESSDKWLECSDILSNLIWTIDPDESGPEARKKLLHLIPEVLRNVREGLVEVSFDLAKTKKMFSLLEAAHVKALQKVSAMPELKKRTPASNSAEPPSQPKADTPAEAISPASDTAPMVAVISQNTEEASENVIGSGRRKADPVAKESSAEKATAKAGLAASIPTDIQEKIDRFQVGAWFEYTEEGGGSSRCKLAALIRSVGKFVFINRNGAKVLDLDEAGLVGLMTEYRLMMLDEGQVFDRALEAIIGGMRG